MKIFHQIQKDFTMYGIGLHQTHLFNWRNRCAILTFICGNVFICAYILFEVDAFQNYADSISTAVAPHFSISCMKWKTWLIIVGQILDKIHSVTRLFLCRTSTFLAWNIPYRRPSTKSPTDLQKRALKS